MKLINSVHQLDVFMFNFLMNVKSYRYLALFARYISKTGDGQLYLLVGAGALLAEGVDSAYLHVTALGFLIERPIYFILKNGFKRNRPQAALKGFNSLITPSDQFSFPSGHTSAAFLFATVTGFYYPFLLLPLLIWAASVGFSRVILGVHFPTDTFVGMGLGISVAFYSFKIITT